jgi:hypothetical protein
VLTHASKYISATKWMDINRQYDQKASSGEQEFARGSITYCGSAFKAAGSKTSLLDTDLQSETLQSPRCSLPPTLLFLPAAGPAGRP